MQRKKEEQCFRAPWRGYRIEVKVRTAHTPSLLTPTPSLKGAVRKYTPLQLGQNERKDACEKCRTSVPLQLVQGKFHPTTASLLSVSTKALTPWPSFNKCSFTTVPLWRVWSSEHLTDIPLKLHTHHTVESNNNTKQHQPHQATIHSTLIRSSNADDSRKCREKDAEKGKTHGWEGQRSRGRYFTEANIPWIDSNIYTSFLSWHTSQQSFSVVFPQMPMSNIPCYFDAMVLPRPSE